MLTKHELMLRIIDLECMNVQLEDDMMVLEERIEKLEKAKKKTTKTTKTK